MRKILILASICTLPSCAAPISFGVIGGAPFTDVVNNPNQLPFNFSSTSSNYTVGPSIQINLPLNLRFEFDALYRPYSFNTTSNAPLPSGVVPPGVAADQWAFPMLAQYRFKFPVVSPFVEAGLSVDHLADISVVGTNITSGPGALIRQTNAGVVIGGGVDVKIPFIRISGELRYTHQSSPYFANISNLNQAEFLVGVHF
jgi:Outer membrane protein beta-barrel domain